MKKFYLLALLFVLSLCHSQNPAAVDVTFDTQDRKPILNAEIRKTVVQPDGKILVLGTFTNYRYHNFKTFPQKNLVRLNADMSIDPTFNIGTGFSADILDVAIQSTGKILVLVKYNGATYTYNGASIAGSFIRLNSNGTRDLTFSGVGIVPTYGKLFVQPDDKVLVLDEDLLFRTNANGSSDNTFSPKSSSLTDLLVLPSGEIITADGTLKKYTSNGLTIPTAQFSTGSFVCPVKSLMLQPDGKILVMGSFYQYNGSETNHLMVRLNANGSFDPSFTALAVNQAPGAVYMCDIGASFNCAALQPDGKILVGGRFPNYAGVDSPNLIRLNSDGTVDNTFTGGTNTEVKTIARLSDGSSVIGMLRDPQIQPRYRDLFVDAILKTNSTGTLSNVDISSQYESERIVILPNNHIAVLGASTKPYHRGLKLLDTNGNLVVNSSLYSGFSAEAREGYDQADFAAVAQPDGKMIVGGYFTSYNGVAKNRIVRLNTDFTIDAAFDIGGGFSLVGLYPRVDVVALQADGKILVAGKFDNYNGTPATGGFVRLTSTGQLDPTFVSSAFIPQNVIVQPDGKILLLDYYGVKRLNPNGSPDSTFQNAVSVNAVALLPNGKMIVAQSGKIKRLNGDGNIDTTFTQLSFSSVGCIYIQPDGKILIGGVFTGFENPDGSYGGMCKGLARLEPDGNFDYGFDTQTGFKDSDTSSPIIKDITLDADGKILVTGRFTRYDGAWTTGVVRLIGGDAHVLRGTVLYDNDNDGCGTLDPAYSMLKFHITSGAVSRDIITNNLGSYSIPFPSGSFTVAPVFENAAYQSISPESVALNFPADGIVVNQDFCVSALGLHPDLEVVIIPVTVARPGVNSTYKVIYKNKGNQILSGSLALTFNDAVMDYVSASPSATMTPNNVTWTFTSLMPNETKATSIVFNLNTPTETPAVNGGDVLAFSASISPAMADDTPSDNTFVFNQTVVNAFDPNDKTCLEGTTVGTAVIGDYVHYMIRFENKGTYAAQNITVTDMIDPAKFDISSLIPLYGSHSFVTRINGNQVDFFFENINLDFANATNDGYVSFKIKTRPTLTAGSTFSNSASIFFDYNAAVVTNTAVTSIAMLAIEDFDSGKYFTVYPNPASHTLNIYKNTEIVVTSYSIYNTMGQLIMVRTAAGQMETIDISILKTGNYFIKVLTDKGNANIRFVKS
jgi:uncharacterized delta-60 repeat protein